MRRVPVVALAFAFLGIASVSANASTRWQGFYFGGNFGQGFEDLDGDIKVFQPGGAPILHAPMLYQTKVSGAFGGLQLGFNQRFGQIVAGLEADMQWSDISGTSATAFPTQPALISAFVYTASASIDRFATLRGRVGLANSTTFIYLTGGLAIVHVDYEARYLITGNNAFANFKSEDTKYGTVIGAGIEQALGSNWSLKLEYQHLSFGDQRADGALFFAGPPPFPSGETVKVVLDTEIDIVRLGLNYRFN